MAKNKIKIEKHFLVPKHTLCSEKEKQEILKKYSATENEMPKILITDAALIGMDIKIDDMIKIEREDPLMGKTYFYRVVVK